MNKKFNWQDNLDLMRKPWRNSSWSRPADAEGRPEKKWAQGCRMVNFIAKTQVSPTRGQVRGRLVRLGRGGCKVVVFGGTPPGGAFFSTMPLMSGAAPPRHPTRTGEVALPIGNFKMDDF